MTTKVSLRIGNRTIPFHVIKSTRRKKTIAILLETSGDIIVRAPHRASYSRIIAAVKSKAVWIIEKQRGLDNRTCRGKEFVSGESFLYRGRSFRLKVLTDGKLRITGVRTRGRCLEVISDSAAGLTPDKIKDALLKWYRKRAEEHLSEKVTVYARKMGMPMPTVLIRDQQKRWASCDSKGKLRFNWRIIMAPSRIIDYVVVHELCHLTYHNHSHSFWKHLGMLMPDYEKRQEMLCKEGLMYSL